MNKIRDYRRKIQRQSKDQEQKAKDFYRNGDKSRAVIALKHKKFMEKELDKIDGAELMLEKTVQGIEQGLMDV